MRSLFIVAICFLSCLSWGQSKNKKSEQEQVIAIALHGGAGNIKDRNLTKEDELAYQTIMDSAISFGYEQLKKGFASTEVVAQVVAILEDSPLFNAGKGSVFTNAETIEMDAAIMDGANLKCGAVTQIQKVKNPILLAKCVMEHSKIIFMSGSGAESFAKQCNLTLVDPNYFRTEKRYQELLRIKDSEKMKLDNDQGQLYSSPEEEKYGTVGCVAVDLRGNLAAATSTGGLTNKKYNRIGDSPIIGAGTYANNKTCAVSCTGRGEDFIRIVAAHQIHNYMNLGKMKLEDACAELIKKDLKKINGRGGVISVNKKGEISFEYNTKGMFRASIDPKGNKFIGIY